MLFRSDIAGTADEAAGGGAAAGVDSGRTAFTAEGEEIPDGGTKKGAAVVVGLPGVRVGVMPPGTMRERLGWKS